MPKACLKRNLFFCAKPDVVYISMSLWDYAVCVPSLSHSQQNRINTFFVKLGTLKTDSYRDALLCFKLEMQASDSNQDGSLCFKLDAREADSYPDDSLCASFGTQQQIPIE